MRLKLDEWMLIILIVLIVLGSCLLGCTTAGKGKGAPLKSLCLMDYEAKKCWTNKTKGEGYDFDLMKKYQDQCLENAELPCWYGLDSDDLKRLINK